MDAVVINGLTKTYRIGVGRARGREMLPPPFDAGVRRLFPTWWDRNTFNALEEVSFSVPTGSSVAIVGHNGAGKSTLLSLIAGVTAPSHGSVVVNGRVVPLVGVLSGFYAELTGRENVYVMGAVYGFGRKEMAARLDEILEFAEIVGMADTPLKRYSSGMGARLAFGMLIALEPEMLLIDEVLAVGDAAFQSKCIRWLDGYRADGGTLLFVSHNLAMVRSTTERAIWLDHGRVMADGPTKEVAPQYAKAMERRDLDRANGEGGQFRKMSRSHKGQRWGLGGARVAQVHVDEDVTNDGLGISINYEASDIDEAIFCVGFVDDSGRDVAAAASAPVRLKKASGSVSCVIRPFPLQSGIYFPVVAILTPDGQVRDRWRLERAVIVETNGSSHLGDEFGPVRLSGDWSHATSDAL